MRWLRLLRAHRVVKVRRTGRVAHCSGDVSLHDTQQTGDRRGLLEARFGIAHATLEPEGHVCESPDEQVVSATSGGGRP